MGILTDTCKQIARFQPMLAATITSFEGLAYPYYMQPKLDGIRCVIKEGIPYTRRMKPIQNIYTRANLRELWRDVGEPYLLDLEVVPLSGIFQDAQTAVMSIALRKDCNFILFDGAADEKDLKLGYNERFMESLWHLSPSKIPYSYIANAEQAKAITKFYQTDYAEGVILRGINSPYKFGRSTLAEGYLLKWKVLADGEARVKGFIAKEFNNNPQEISELGYAKRSSSKEGMIKLDTLGALLVEGINGKFEGVTFKIGSGFTEEQRKEIWNNKETYRNKTLTYEYQPTGTKNKPRQPIFKCWRED
jgi:DNA ligase-1